MLQTIRDRLTGWVAVLIIAGIGVALVISFGKSRTDVSMQNFAARVNSEDISIADFRQVYQNQLTRQQEATKSELTPEMTQKLQKTVLEEMVRNRVVAQYVNELGYRVDNATLRNAIEQIQAFQIDGKFSVDSYRAALASQGLNVPTFEKEQRTAMEIGQLQNGLLASAFFTPSEFRRFLALEGQKRQVSFVVVDAKQLAAGFAVSDVDVKAYYDAHPEKFESPESVAIDYVEARLADVGGSAPPDEAQLRAAYDANPAKYRTPEERHARHILLTIGKDRDEAATQRLAEELKAKIAAGGDFATLARQYSGDPGSAAGGGDLGWAAKGNYVEPFEKALFALKPGETSEPVRTEFGIHLIQLVEVRGGTQRPFDEVREEIAREAGGRDAQDRYAALTEKMDDAALQNPNSLDPVAKATGLSLNHLDVFTRAGGGPFGANRPLIDAVFSHAVLEEGENSPLVEIGEGRTVIVRVAEHRKAHVRPLDEVKAEAEAGVRAEKAAALARRRGDEILAQVRAGSDLATVARGLGLQATSPQAIGRGSADVPPELLAAIFRAPKPASGAPVLGSTEVAGGSVAVFRLDSVEPGRPDDTPREQRDARKMTLARQAGIADAESLAGELRRRASVVVAPNLIEQGE